MADDKTFTQAEVDEQIAGLKKKNDELLTEQRTLNAKLRAFDGIDLDGLKASQTRLSELEQEIKANKAGITQEQLNKMRVELRGELEKEYAPKLQLVEKLTAENRSLKLDTVVKDIMGKNGVRAERIDSLFRLSSDNFDLTDDGKVMVKGSAKDPVKFIGEDLKGGYPEFFQGSGSSGTGSGKSGAPPAAGKVAATAEGFMGALNDFKNNKGKVEFDLKE